MATALVAFHNDLKLKIEVVAKMEEHRREDRFIRGTYLTFLDDDDRKVNHWRGCFHGCLTAEALAAERGISLLQFYDQEDSIADVDWWDEGERLWGIPSDLGRRLDALFESHDSPDRAADWAVAVTEAIPCGANLFHFNSQIDDALAASAETDQPGRITPPWMVDALRAFGRGDDLPPLISHAEATTGLYMGGLSY